MQQLLRVDRNDDEYELHTKHEMAIAMTTCSRHDDSDSSVVYTVSSNQHLISSPDALNFTTKQALNCGDPNVPETPSKSRQATNVNSPTETVSDVGIDRNGRTLCRYRG
ncbi:hypothetical protein VTN49DRAFT_828 [Thermomyces lanuginosus]|uniref:uncharacterized protein n=1 Tax=Thermomyces lanuginosus TaxID=5541 RepID=UPI003743C466